MGGGISALTRKSKEAEPISAHGRLHPVIPQPSAEAQSAVCMHACIWTARQGSSHAVCWQEDPRDGSVCNPAVFSPPPSSQAKSPVSMSSRASGRFCSSEEHEGLIEDDFSFDDDYDPLDLERIEADYRATRARAIFSAGAASRVVKLERLRSFSCMPCHARPLFACPSLA
jgi:hypothetical protein